MTDSWLTGRSLSDLVFRFHLFLPNVSAGAMVKTAILVSRRREPRVLQRGYERRRNPRLAPSTQFSPSQSGSPLLRLCEGEGGYRSFLANSNCGV